jgi:hypothetical protein
MMTSQQRSILWRAGAYVLLVMLIGLHVSMAQAQPAVTFGASVTSAAGELTTRLTWSTTPTAASCTAAGHPSWTGSKAASGALDLPAITLSGTYSLTLSCTWPGDSQARLTWTAPTTNTDGGALAKCASQTATGPCLRSFIVHRGLSAGTLSDARAVDDRNAVAYTWTGLAAGTHFFAVEAVNGDGVRSEPSTVVSKVISATQTRNESVTLTVNPKPNTVSGLEVE